MNIEFKCEKCGSALKVRSALAGRSVQCPRCRKKTAVPKAGGESGKPAAKPEPTKQSKIELKPVTSPPVAKEPAAAPDTPSAPVPEKPEPPRAVETPTGTPTEKTAEKPAGDEAKTAEMAEKLRRVEKELAGAKQRAEEAEKASRETLQEKEAGEEKIRREVAERHEAELAAAKKSIADLESSLSSERAKRTAMQSRPSEETAAEPEPVMPALEILDMGDEETIDPDSLIADIKSSRFGRHLRTAIVVHVCIVALTSIGYLLRVMRGTPEEEPAPTPAPAVSKAAAPVPPVAPVSPPAEPKAEEPATDAAASTTGRGDTELEKAVQSLPDKGELPTDSAISLEDDL